jgi:hypothetical protein
MIEFLRAQRADGIEKFLIDKKPGMAHTKLLLSEKILEKPFAHRELRKD